MLTLSSDAAVDLQIHTTHSDGTWTPEQLIDYLLAEGFGLAAITDHDRVDTAASLQGLASKKQMPLLTAVEMTTTWQGAVTDVLCYGFDPKRTALGDLAQDVQRRQRANTAEVFQNLCQKGHIRCEDADILSGILAKPGAQQPHELYALVDTLEMMKGAGFRLATNPISDVVDAAHGDGAVCLIAHPGRSDGFLTYTVDLLDQLRREVPIDGLESYYPAHTPAQIEIFSAYAQKHRLLVSSGSDSHGPDKPPIKYRADLSRTLLERLGIQIQ